MEDIILQIYGTLILTFIGFVVPILTVALSFFPEGIKVLTRNYENEQKQAEKNLEEELKKKGEKGVDYDALTRNIAILQDSKNKASRRLFYMNPGAILSRSGLALGIALVAFLSSLFLLNEAFLVPLTLATISIASLLWAVVIFWNVIEIIVEASTAVQAIQKTAEEKTLELLSALVDNSKSASDSMFIDQKKIHIYFSDEEVTPAKEYTFSVNNKHDVKIKFKNLSDRMLKTAELGFTFPEEFLIEKTDNISSIFTGEKEKIVRFKHDHIQANESYLEGKIGITFLKVGTFDVDYFVKGENLKNATTKFKIKVVE